MTDAIKVKVTSVDYHRNGVTGIGFYVVMFGFKSRRTVPPQSMMAIVFDTEEHGYCAVLDATETAAGNTGLGNMWRGDHFEKTLRDEIARRDREITERIKKGE